MHKPKKKSDAVSTAIRLPREIHDWLKEQPGGLTNTIKRGFEMLQVAEGADDPTRQLALAIFGIAEEIALEAAAPWHSDGGSHRAFRRALLVAISKWRPEDYDANTFNKVNLRPLSERPNASEPISDADDLGIDVAHDVLELPDRTTRQRVRAARQKTLQDMIELNHRRGEEGND